MYKEAFINTNAYTYKEIKQKKKNKENRYLFNEVFFYITIIIIPL